MLDFDKAREVQFNDWSSFLIVAEREIKAADRCLTNRPSAKEEIIEHLQSAIVALDQVGAWVRSH